MRMKNKGAMERILKGQSSQGAVRFSMAVKSVNTDQRIVTGEVYAPNILDTHDEMMEPEDVVHLAHTFMQLDLKNAIDVMHDNQVIDAMPLESFIARGHPDYNEGAWVLSVKINDDKAWKAAKSGKLGGYSVEASVYKVKAVVETENVPVAYGVTEKQEDHDHAFYAVINEKGVVVGGFTSVDNGHRHIIKYGTRTEITDGHAHRMFLP